MFNIIHVHFEIKVMNSEIAKIRLQKYWNQNSICTYSYLVNYCIKADNWPECGTLGVCHTECLDSSSPSGPLSQISWSPAPPPVVLP